MTASSSPPPAADTVRWGILATGRIAHDFAAAIAASQTGRLVAVASRTAAGAAAFTADHLPAELHRHGSYQALLDDPDVDVVYVAMPHTWHFEWSSRALNAGKHVLCEKSMTVTAAETEALVARAAAKCLFLMEAFMYRCHPQTWQLIDLVADGAVGEVRMIAASLGLDVGDVDSGRMVERALAGGAILDVGCYVASLVRLVAGAAGRRALDPVSVTAVGRLNPQHGTDDWTAAIALFEGDVVATMECAIRCHLERRLVVRGSAGIIQLNDPWHSPPGNPVVLSRIGRGSEEFSTAVATTQATLEADVVGRAVLGGITSAPEMPWADSVGNMRTLDQWRRAIGLRYDADEAPPPTWE